MHTTRNTLLPLLLALALAACSAEEPAQESSSQPTAAEEAVMGKPVVYQVFTRLFGNQVTTNKPWGTIEENGVGKFSDFSDEALAGIRERSDELV